MVYRRITYNDDGPLVKWYVQGKPETLGEKPVPVTLGSPQISCGLAWDWTPASMVRGHQLSA